GVIGSAFLIVALHSLRRPPRRSLCRSLPLDSWVWAKTLVDPLTAGTAPSLIPFPLRTVGSGPPLSPAATPKSVAGTFRQATRRFRLDRFYARSRPGSAHRADFLPLNGGSSK